MARKSLKTILLGCLLLVWCPGALPAVADEGAPRAWTPEASGLARFASALKSTDWSSAQPEEVQATLERALVGTEWKLKRLSLERFRSRAGMIARGFGHVSTASECVGIAEVVAALGTPRSIALPALHGAIEISSRQRIEEQLRDSRAIDSAEYLLNPAQWVSFSFGFPDRCFHSFRVGDIAGRAPPGTARPDRPSFVHFARLLQGTDWDFAEPAAARTAIESGLASTGWFLQEFTLNRYRINRGMVASASGRVETADQCFRIGDVVAALGPPRAISLEGLGFLDISTPESVDEHLARNPKVSSALYILEPAHRYSFQFSSRTGCFAFFRVGHQ